MSTATTTDHEQLALEGFQGHDVETVELGLSGAVKLVITDPDHVALISALRLQDDVRITIETSDGEGVSLPITGQVSGWTHKVRGGGAAGERGAEEIASKITLKAMNVEGYRTPEDSEGEDPVDAEPADGPHLAEVPA